MQRREFLRTLGGFSTPDMTRRVPAHHVINRLTFGPTPDLYDYVQRIGPQAFIQEQLSPDTIDNSALEERITAEYPLLSEKGGVLAQEYADDRGRVVFQLVGGTVTRAVYSQRQLLERMVEFWSDHFNVFINKGPTVFLKVEDDREVIRKHAMGRFRDLLGASAHSPAMLFYLDNVQSNREQPNENYARELLELHTLGVSGGYTEDDVKEVARCFTGWSVGGPNSPSGEFVFRGLIHDHGNKEVLGYTIPGSRSTRDGEQVLDILASHPSTARFISTKLIRRFVSDDPPQSLINTCTQTFLQSDGDIRAVLETLFGADEFWNAPPKFKRPFDLVVGLLRALDYQVSKRRSFERSVAGLLQLMQQVPFTWAAPDGFPDTGDYWMANLLSRWNTALAILYGDGDNQPNFERLVRLIQENNTGGSNDALHALSRYLFGRDLDIDELAIIRDFANITSDRISEAHIVALALMLASPTYQYR